MPAAPGDVGGVTLGELGAAVPGSVCLGEARLTGVTMRAEAARPGDLYVAVPGAGVDGHDLAATAVARGATALVVERRLPLAVPQLVVPSARAAAGPVSALVHGEPARALALVGVTGTNGKTTTCELTRAALEAAGRPAGQITSTGAIVAGRLVAPTSLTTPEAPELQADLATMVASGAWAAAVEVSSHGLEQGRVGGIVFDVAVFLGLTPEHLDFHGDMESYWRAKARLFRPEQCRRAVICVDSPWGRRLADECEVPVTTFGTGADADVRLSVRSRGLAGIEVTLVGTEGMQAVQSPVVGRVNATNVAAAYLAAGAVGVDGQLAAGALARAGAPSGRFEVVPDADRLVVVDYAHTPDSLAALIATARDVTPGRVHLVLGARGDRYREKRQGMAAVATTADVVVFTTDSPGSEDPAALVDQLRRAAPDGAAEVRMEVDRAAAIEGAVAAMDPGDTLLVTGRGNEQSQRFGARTVALDDRVVAGFALGAHPTRPEAAGRPGPVGVVIPAHDAATTLAAAVRSVLAQSVPVAEIVVVDDGSSDGTAAVARSFGSRVTVVQQPCAGPSRARNAGIARIASPWVAFLDADDEWAPDKLERQLRVVREDPGVLLVASEWQRDDAGADPVHAGAGPVSPVPLSQLVLLNRFQTSTVLVRRDALCRAGGFDPRLDGAEDWDLWVRLAHLGRIVKVDLPLVRYTDVADGYSKDLVRHHRAALEVVRREVGQDGRFRDRQVEAWHHLRFAVAFRLVGQRDEARTSLRSALAPRLAAATLVAGPRYLVPFLGRRVRHRVAGRSASR